MGGKQMFGSFGRKIYEVRHIKTIWMEIADKNSANIEEYFVARQIIYLISGLIEP